MSRFLTIGQVAQALKVPDHRIYYLFRARKIPEVRRVGGRRVFTQENIRLIAETLGVPCCLAGKARAKKKKAGHDKRR